MPKTSLLFLLAAIAICGLPPLNGFISEFLIYSGIFHWLKETDLFSLIVIAFSIIGLVLIGGLAILCFTKAFGIVFLGSSRENHHENISEVKFGQLFPLYLIGIFIISIGLFPEFFVKTALKPVSLFLPNQKFATDFLNSGLLHSLKSISWYSFVFILFVIIMFFVRKFANRNKTITAGATWGCGYNTSSTKLQYTASSYVRSFSKLVKPVLEIEKKEIEFTEVFPEKKEYETHPYDKVEKTFIDRFLSLSKKFSEYFTFLQNGRLQQYILYGIIFITAVIGIPFLIEKIGLLIKFLSNL